MTRWWNLLVVLFLFVLPPLLVWPSFRLWGVSALEDDLIYYFPQRWLLGQFLANGHWPLWNPWVGLGYPFLGDPQSAVLYPFNWLFAVWPVELGYPADFCLHFSLAGLGFYLFARATGCMRPAALLGAVAFMFCGFLVGHRVHLTMQNSAAWLPWMLWAAQGQVQALQQLRLSAQSREQGPEKLPADGHLAKRSLARWIGTYALFSALQFLAGHAQVVFYTQLFCAAYLLVLGRFNGRVFVALAIGGTLAGLMVAPQLLATWQLVEQCARTSAPFSQMAENSLIPVYLLLWVVPWFFGTRTPNLYPQPWWGHWHWCEMAGYVGLLTLLVGCWAVWRFVRQDRIVRFMAVAGLTGLVLAMGDSTPIYGWLWHILRYLPLVGGFRCPARWLLVVNLAQAMLLARGLHHLWYDSDPRFAPSLARWLRRGGVVLALGVAGLLTAGTLWLYQPGLAERLGALPGDLEPIKAGLSQAFSPRNPALWIPALLLGLIAIAAPVLGGRDNSPRRWWVWLAILLVDLASVVPFADMSGWGDHRRITRGRQFLEEPLGLYLNTENGSSPPAADSSRLPPRLFLLISGAYDDPLSTLTPSTNQLYGIQTATTYGPLQRRVERRVWNTAPWAVPQDSRRIAWQTRLLDLFGVQYVFSDSPQIQPNEWDPGADPFPDTASQTIWSRIPARSLSPNGWEKWSFASADERCVQDAPPRSALLLLEVRSQNSKPQGRLAMTWQAGPQEPVQWLFVEPEELYAGLRRIFFVPAPVKAGAGEFIVRAMDEAKATVQADLRPLEACTSPPRGPSGAEKTDFPGLWQMKHAYPRVYVAERTQEVCDPLLAADRLVLGGASPPASDLTSRHKNKTPPGASCGYLATGIHATPVKIERYEPNQVMVRVIGEPGQWAGQPRLLVLNDAFDPGWQVRVNGETRPVMTVNALVRGVWITGPGVVDFEYRPWGWPWALWLTAAGVAGVLMLWFWKPDGTSK